MIHEELMTTRYKSHFSLSSPFDC